MIQKNNRFTLCPEFRRRLRHHHPPPIESEDHQRFSTLWFCRALLHPIALLSVNVAIDCQPIR
jgi:hypothetical protein